MTVLATHVAQRVALNICDHLVTNCAETLRDRPDRMVSLSPTLCSIQNAHDSLQHGGLIFGFRCKTDSTVCDAEEFNFSPERIVNFYREKPLTFAICVIPKFGILRDHGQGMA